MDAVRGLTIVPAMAGGLGDPADPRSYVKHVWQSGETVYDTKEEPRLW